MKSESLQKEPRAGVSLTERSEGTRSENRTDVGWKTEKKKEENMNENNGKRL